MLVESAEDFQKALESNGDSILLWQGQANRKAKNC